MAIWSNPFQGEAAWPVLPAGHAASCDGQAPPKELGVVPASKTAWLLAAPPGLVLVAGLAAAATAAPTAGVAATGGEALAA
jgi:hypothetical protein